LKPVLYLSHFFKQHRQEYYEQLQSVRDRGTWEDWMVFFLRGVIEVSKQATETARRILTLRENHRSTITEKFGRAAGNGHRVLEYLYEHPILSANEVRDLIGTTFPAANDLVAKFVNAGILREITGQSRNRKFMYQSYIDLFRDQTGQEESP
jgi:Fic family protein